MSQMNDLVQAQAGEILKQISTAIQTTGDFAQKELPDIAQQYIVYGRFSGIMAVTIGAAFMIACIVVAIGIWRHSVEIEDSEFNACLIAPGLLFSFAGVVTVINAQNLLLNIFAPKVWLILEIKNLFS
jgi:hypothetical protein